VMSLEISGSSVAMFAVMICGVTCRIMPALEMCDAFAMEVLIDENIQSTLLANIFMTGETTLQTLLTPVQYDSLQWFAMRNTGMSISYFNKMKPLYVAMMLEMLSGDDSILKTADPFLDQYFENSATAQQKKIIGLETVEEQMAIFDVMSYKDQAQLLLKSMREYSEDTTEFDEMIQYYLNNDLSKMMEFENDFSMPDSLYDALITDRNIKMAKRIDSMINEQSIFIAVGAGHLGGEEGLVSLLRNKGYQVVPVIPIYSQYLKDGWYQFYSRKNDFKIDFPLQPELKKDNTGIECDVYSSHPDKKSSNEELLEVKVYSKKLTKEDFQSAIFPNISDIKFQDNELNHFTYESVGKLKGIGKTFFSNDKTYVLLYTYKRSPKNDRRFFDSFSIIAQ
jgi:uncharacterized protein YbaP (TraB family)